MDEQSTADQASGAFDHIVEENDLGKAELPTYLSTVGLSPDELFGSGQFSRAAGALFSLSVSFSS